MKKIGILVIVLISAVNSYGQEKKTMKEFDSNFAHTVYFWLKNPESKEDKASFVASLQKFLNASKYAKTNFIGYPPKASREVVDGSFTFSLIVTFESAEAQQKYQEEDVHLKFIEESSHLWTKVIVYDSVPVQ
ncbi:Dabb family protein [uncultured Maribacter sp.]|uniref:Dabb family protein n=1 Tax=uncultured Maribacter sp. TaxID=431308 RepID=UPI0026131389|nr:Dabb family protein [uncultured Maribacter sp.]